MITGCMASTRTALGQYSATVLASVAKATPKMTGMATHSTAAPTPT